MELNSAPSKPERLLMAALDYSMERHVVYVAPAPPSVWCQSMAARFGKKISYLPIGTFCPVTPKKIRQFNVSDGHHVRKYARDYIHWGWVCLALLCKEKMALRQSDQDGLQ